MSFDPQPGDVYEDPSGLIVMVLRRHPACLRWWECVVICDLARASRFQGPMSAGSLDTYSLNGDYYSFVKLAP